MPGQVYISESAKVGKDCIIQLGAVIEDDVVIGDNCLIGYYTIINSGVKIGNKSEILPFCFIAENVTIGSKVKILEYADIGKLSVIEDCVYIGSKVLFANTRRISHMRSFKSEIIGPHIGYGARIASGSLILPKVKIGKESLIGAGAVVTKDVPDKEIWFGFPAVKRGNVPESEFLKE